MRSYKRFRTDTKRKNGVSKTVSKNIAECTACTQQLIKYDIFL